MDITQEKYNQHALVCEMYESIDALHQLYQLVEMQPATNSIIESLRETGKLMLTGEGSSRIFPAKNMRSHALQRSAGVEIHVEGSTFLKECQLDAYTLIGASNSGKTNELITLFQQLNSTGHRHIFGLTCTPDSKLSYSAKSTFLLTCGAEKAVAATKSVMAQAFYYDALLARLQAERLNINELTQGLHEVLNYPINQTYVDKVRRANTVYFAGHNNGVAEELALKTNEIIRKKSAYLPGTYLLHGIEEVISADDVIILVDVMESEIEKIDNIYRAIGTPVIAFSTKPNSFDTLPIPASGINFQTYLKLSMGWNLLAETGISMGIDLDKPIRARKVGNEYSM